MPSRRPPAAVPPARRVAVAVAAAGLALGTGVAVAPAATPAMAAPLPAAPVPAAPVPAAAAPVPAAQAPGSPTPTPAAGTTVCTVSDQRLHEISGLVTLGSGYVMINDSNPDPAAIRIFYLDAACRVTRTVSYPSAARDTEDLAVGADGSLWVADTGDNANAKTHRSSVAVWRLAPGASRPVLYRLAYPDGHHDAEALLIDHDDLPVIITKEVTGGSHAYKPTAALVAGAEPVALRSVGRISARITGTDNPFGLAGQLAITGAGVSPDRRRVVLRTYADAYEYDVPNGDVVAALTAGSPRLTPLPGEPQGESIAYSSDGADLLTISDAAGPTPLLRWPRAAGSAGDGGSRAGNAPPAASGTPRASRSASADPSASGLVASARGLVTRSTGTVAAGVATAVVGVAVLGLMIFRRRVRGD